MDNSHLRIIFATDSIMNRVQRYKKMGKETRARKNERGFEEQLDRIYDKLERHERLSPEEQTWLDKELEEYKKFDYPGKTMELIRKTRLMNLIAICISVLSIVLFGLMRLLM